MRSDSHHAVGNKFLLLKSLRIEFLSQNSLSRSLSPPLFLSLHRWTPTWLWFRSEKPHAVMVPVLLRRNRSTSKSRSGMPSLSGLGILLLITVQFAGITSWISALSVKPIRLVQPAKSARLLGVYAITPSISTALVDG